MEATFVAVIFVIYEGREERELDSFMEVSASLRDAFSQSLRKV